MLGEGIGSWNNAHHMREMRAAVKQRVPQAALIGEHFFEATPWLQGDQEDGAMNYYGFAHPVWAWLAGVDGHGQPLSLATHEFERWLTRARAAIPYANQLAQLNLLDSHDTPRLFTLLGGNTQAMKLAVTLLMSYPGVPCIYYGDEIGLEGGPDPDCRRCFEWDSTRWNMDLFEHYRALARLRRERREWAHGDYQVLISEGDVFGYARYDASHVTLVLVNRGAAADVTLDLGRLPVAPALWREHGSAHVVDTNALRVLHLPARASAVYLSVN
jgi:alpha-glucosidase